MRSTLTPNIKFQLLLIKVKAARFKRKCASLPPLIIPPSVREAAEKIGHKFN